MISIKIIENHWGFCFFLQINLGLGKILIYLALRGSVDLIETNLKSCC